MNPTKFQKQNVVDTCSLWNLLSSDPFYGTAKAAGCGFSCTQFVIYECLHKPRTTEITEPQKRLRDRFRKENESGAIKDYTITIDDLQTIEILNNRKKLGKGELSAIAFAMQTRQAFLSDDHGAMKLALTELSSDYVQSTSLLFAWLFFHGYLADHQKENIIQDLEAHGRYMRPHYEAAYDRALQFKLMSLDRNNRQNTQPE